jgi:anaerobic magnesium-protoporphyrin IX monomethyl ester cyclase
MKLLVIENPRPLTLEHYNDVANAPLSASLNSGYALSIACRSGWEAAFLDLTSCSDGHQDMADRIIEENADLILFHWVYSWGNEKSLLSILQLIRAEHGCWIGAFGLFPSMALQKLSDYAPQLDFILAGEFEATLEDLLKQLSDNRSFSSIPGTLSSGSKFMHRELITDLDTLPVPHDVGANCEYTTMNIAASRGCFGNCSFCFISTFYGCSKRRERSIASFEHELATRLRRRCVDNIYFIDPTFIGLNESGTGRVQEISSILKSYQLPFGFETRVDTVNEELFARLASNGARSVFLGIESGCDTVLQRINKRINREQIIKTVRTVQNCGIHLSVGFIMFDPDSTLKELLTNYGMLEELGLLYHHDQTVNMLYHSQIVLYGSKSWYRYSSENRLLPDRQLPFEARYRFKHDNVARVCHAMMNLSYEYFKGMDAAYRSQGMASNEQFACCHSLDPAGVNGSDLNRILKDAFLTFIKLSDRGNQSDFRQIEQRYVHNIQDCFRT